MTRASRSLGRRTAHEARSPHRISPMTRLVVPEGKPAAAVRRWAPVLRFTRRVAEAERVKLEEIRLHSHPRGAQACFDAQASWEDHFIEFCGGQNRETALHELAHLIVEDYHSKTWAVSLMALHARYLPAERCKRADRVLAIEYRSARPLYLARYGSSAPRFKSDTPARKCKRKRRRR